jgi:hypothetical protein
MSMDNSIIAEVDSGTAIGQVIESRLARIGDLKKALTSVQSVTDEVELLRKLSNEISALRELRQSEYLRSYH